MGKKQVGIALAMMVTALGTTAFAAEEKADVSGLNCLTDLHLHLDGSISIESARELAQMQGIELPKEDEKVRQMLCADKNCRDLNEFLEKFELPGQLLQTREALKLAAENLLKELKEDGVMYAEIRFAPQLHTQQGLSMEEAVQAVLEGIEEAPIEAKCILCCMRGEDNYQQNVETVRLAADYLDKGVCAVDLAGAEALFATKEFDYVFALAKQKGVPFTIHAGEADGPESVKTALEFGAKRIGHGIRSVESEEVLELLKEKQAALELCPSSNLCTKIFDDIKEYPLDILADYEIPITINTDDMAVVGTDIKKEYDLLIETFELTKDDIHTLLYNSVSASFADAQLKSELKQAIDIDMGYVDEDTIKKRKVIIDTDIAADDATAILMAASDPSIEILGVTVAAGNVSLEQAAQNALMTLELAGKKNVPVCKGAEVPLSGVERPTFSIFGEDGMGDADLIRPTGEASRENAVDFILNTIRENPGQVELICLAPMTNIAQCIQKDPETMHQVKRVWSMGTAGLGMGNATPVAEFNTYKDAEAYEVFLEEELPSSVIGLDMDREETYLTEDVFEKMKNAGPANQFIAAAFGKLADNMYKESGRRYGDCPDGVAMACILWPEFIQKMIQTHAVCVTQYPECYGQVLFYEKGIMYDSQRVFEHYNTQLVTGADTKEFIKLMMNALDRVR